MNKQKPMTAEAVSKNVGRAINEAAMDLAAFGSCAVHISAENGEVEAVCLKPETPTSQLMVDALAKMDTTPHPKAIHTEGATFDSERYTKYLDCDKPGSAVA